ncbi:alpha,alpha-trehalase TreA [Hymenobacter sp. H14-R3]|uniref:alpha,alpha-trehalase TreA n=1 Tax=Hymenobacter sp. H14-R3 TaxID=3046308 RepID=UPI0024BB6179|nr:alpha,alpha-trehalase TreA [Hymenobacter sp. H14-R3]MDJ0364062.1 alpha,alpha-trehalase TreA [Hymenobacter sp. H14-R3]
MKNLLLSASLLLASLTAAAQPTPAPTPRQLYPGLFEAVQMGRVYPDGKTFVDALPTAPPPEVMAAYERLRGQPGFALQAFVKQYFTAPVAGTDLYRSNIGAGIRAHLDTLWTVLSRPAQLQPVPYSSLLPLPRPYVVPGGRFREMYYWDSYFTMLGLREAGRTALVRDMVADFASLIDRYGHIPNGTRTYYISRSQPPFFALMVQLLAESEGIGSQAYTQFRPQLLKEHAYWTANGASPAPGTAERLAVRMPGGELLSRYWDDSDQPREESYREDVEAAKTSAQPPAEFYRNVRAAAASGWDFSSRWFEPGQGLGTIRTTRLVPVDLNCLLLTLEQTLDRAARQAGDSAEAFRYRQLGQRRAGAIRRYCWDAKAGFYTDYDLDKRQPTLARTLAAAFPLAFGVATPAQASQVAGHLRQEFLRPGGLLTTPVPSGQQWDAPNAWAPLEYIAIVGLRRYGQHALADTIADRWTRLNVRGFAQTGKLLEKYNVEATGPAAGGGGEYPLQDGFGWTNGVLLTLENARQRAKTEPAPRPAIVPSPARKAADKRRIAPMR